MKVINDIKSKVSKKEFMFTCLFGIMCIFNYYIFNQFDILLNNPAEFNVTVAEVAWLLIWRPIIILTVIISVLVVICCYSKKGFVYTIATLFGLVLAGYVQVLFMNNDVLNSLTIERIGQYILNTALYLFIIFIPIAIVYIERREKKGFTPKLALAVSFVILGMQLFGVMSVAATAPQAKDNGLYYFSVDEQLKLSKDENIIVFVMDMLDTSFTNAVFEKYPESKEIFDGFTYYTDNISEYPSTFPSVPAMLTGKQFNESTKNQINYYQNAWNNEILFSALKEKKYTTLGLLDTITSFYGFNDLDGKFDNIKKADKKNRTIDGSGFFGGMLSYALMRQSPILLKTTLFKPTAGHWKNNNHSVKIKNTPDYFPGHISVDTDLKFYKKLMTPNLNLTEEEETMGVSRLGLSATREEKTFSFVHMRSSHDPFGYNEKLEKTSKSNVTSQTYGSFKILDEYFSQMKTLGIYDNATIIVLADHGCGNGKDIAEVVDPPVASLLIKESVNDNSECKDGVALKIPTPENQPQLSHRNFASTILEVVGYVHDGEEKLPPSYFDVIEGKTTYDASRGNINYTDITSAGVQTRYFYFVKYMNLASSKYFFKYRITGYANDIRNWKKEK